jgi:hypothetical protein
VFLPNSDRRYAIDASAFAATYTLNVSVQNGLLTQVDWKGNTTGVSTDVVSKTGDLVKTAVDTSNQREADKQTAKKALAEAELALEQAQRKFDQVRADPTSTQAQKDEAEFALRKAKINWAAAQNALNRLQGDPAVDAAGSTAPHLPRPSVVAAASAPTAPAPRFLYSVVESPDGYVKLVEVPLPRRSP